MTTIRLAGVLIAVTLACAAHSILAQEKGNTAAAELTSSSQAALQQLYASVPLAKQLGQKAAGLGSQGNKISKFTPK